MTSPHYRFFSLHSEHISVAGYLSIEPLSPKFSGFSEARRYFEQNDAAWDHFNNHEEKMFPHLLWVEGDVLFFIDEKTGKRAEPLRASDKPGSRIRIHEAPGTFTWEEAIAS